MFCFSKLKMKLMLQKIFWQEFNTPALSLIQPVNIFSYSDYERNNMPSLSVGYIYHFRSSGAPAYGAWSEYCGLASRLARG
jgi:hypothetical protein